MKVFISWSGERSRQVGELLDGWLKCVIQAINAWRSDRDIDRGSLWFTQITNQLQETSIGIVCITQENKNNPWILFETGALAKGLSSSRVCTFLIDLQPSDIKDPLAQFNHTRPVMEEVRGLVRTLNSILENQSLPDKILDQVFETYWPQFQREFKSIIENTPEQNNVEVRTENEILAEILDKTRSMDRRLSYVESENTRKHLKQEVNGVNKKNRLLLSRSVAENKVRELLDIGKDPVEIINLLTERYYISGPMLADIIRDQTEAELEV